MMTALTNNALTPAELAEQLLGDAMVIGRFVESTRELQVNIRAYEERFGISSEDIHAAIEDGRLVETEDVCDWIMDYELLKRAWPLDG
jgi:hypothetical protein